MNHQRIPVEFGEGVNSMLVFNRDPPSDAFPAIQVVKITYLQTSEETYNDRP